MRLSPWLTGKRGVVVWVVVITGLVSTWCGSDAPPAPGPAASPTAAAAPAGSPSPGAGPSPGASPGADPEPTSTATPQPPRADAITREVAAAGVLRAGDFGSGWKVDTPPRPYSFDPEQSCSYQEGGPESLLERGAVRQGPTMRLQGSKGYAGSAAFVFPDAEAAKTWIAVVDTIEWVRCRRNQLQEFQDQRDEPVTVRIQTRESPGLGRGGFASFASFANVTADGSTESLAEIRFYRLGRVVIRVGLDLGVMTDRQLEVFGDGIDSALRASYARVDALASG